MGLRISIPDGNFLQYLESHALGLACLLGVTATDDESV